MTELPARSPAQRSTPPTTERGAVRPISSATSRRISKRTLRSMAWVGGGAAFLAAWTVIDVVPKPAQSEAAPARATPRRLVVIHHVIRKVIIQAQAPSVGGLTTTSGSGGGVVYVPAPVSAPVVSSGGSQP